MILLVCKSQEKQFHHQKSVWYSIQVCWKTHGQNQLSYRTTPADLHYTQILCQKELLLLHLVWHINFYHKNRQGVKILMILYYIYLVCAQSHPVVQYSPRTRSFVAEVEAQPWASYWPPQPLWQFVMFAIFFSDGCDKLLFKQFIDINPWWWVPVH